MSHVDIARQLRAASSLEQLHAAAQSIGAVSCMVHRARLDRLYLDRAAMLKAKR